MGACWLDGPFLMYVEGFGHSYVEFLNVVKAVTKFFIVIAFFIVVGLRSGSSTAFLMLIP